MSTLQNDIESITNHKSLFKQLAGRSILVTGATGLVGSMLIRSILFAKYRYGYDIDISAQIRNYEKAKIIFKDLYDELNFVVKPEKEYDYIVHTVSPTKSRYFIDNPVETIESSVGSAMSILNAAKESNATIVYLSSMEQYGIPLISGQKMTENDIGIIDHLNVRSSYSESKRLCECLCASFAKEYDVDVKIARLSQTFGAGISLADNRMPMQFAKSVVNKTDIVLHTEGRSLSNFVYLSDAITGILTILLYGEKGQAYNVCNDKETRSVYEIAKLVCDEVANGSIDVIIDKKENMGYAPDVCMYLDTEKIQKLGWKAETSMKEAYIRLINYIRENEELI